jgi:hypothetical protein
MRLGHAIFLASTAALLTLAAPALAKNSEANSEAKAEAQKAGGPASSSCHAYQQEADGTWTQLPCQEMGSSGQTQHKPAPHAAGEETH